MRPIFPPQKLFVPLRSVFCRRKAKLFSRRICVAEFQAEVLPASRRQIVRSPIVWCCRQDAGSTLWARAKTTSDFGARSPSPPAGAAGRRPSPVGWERVRV